MKLTATMLLMVSSLSAQTEFLKPEGLPAANGYSHVVVVNPGKLAFVSGQVATDLQGKLVGKGDLKAQTEQVFENLKTALAAAGTSFEHVVKLTYFIKDYKPESVAAIREVRNRFVNTSSPPASSLLGVMALVQPDYLIEVEAVAVVPAKPPR
jgi:enamine deaminase RidA (YjgF/YER057c/UK114 family)